MAFTTVYNADLHIVEVTYEGRASSNELKDEEEQSFALARKHNTDRFLVDLTNYESSLSSIQVLDGVSSYDDKAIRPVCIAVVTPLSEDAQKDARFYETACVNRGWNAQTFKERQEAIDWLLYLGAE